MSYRFRRLNERDAEAIVTWRYEQPYAFYNMTADAIPELVDPEMEFVAVDRDGELIGFFGYGICGQPPAGREAGVYADDALDIAVGLRPDLTGKGLGASFVEAGLDYARAFYSPRIFRLSVACFNRRAILVYERTGFYPGAHFNNRIAGEDYTFMVMTRPAELPEDR